MSASSQGEGLDKKYGNAVGTLDDDPRTGWTTRTKPVEPVQIAVFELKKPLVLKDDEHLDIVLMQRALAPRELIGRFRLSLTDQQGAAVRTLNPMPMEQLAEVIKTHHLSFDQPFTSADVQKDLREKLLAQFLEGDPMWQAADARNNKAIRQRNEAKKAAGDLNVTVLAERANPRETHILERGVWDQHGDKVGPGVLPAVLIRKPEEV
ncbi:MAG: hypothetical protein GY904_23930, partial [Planctomycetaceae bacterium]|nr:hypothetical protein [Planctomycetaceae bacterium]